MAFCDITLCKNVEYLPECLQIQIIIKSIYTMLTIKVFHKSFCESSLLRAFITCVVNIICSTLHNDPPPQPISTERMAGRSAGHRLGAGPGEGVLGEKKEQEEEMKEQEEEMKELEEEMKELEKMKEQEEEMKEQEKMKELEDQKVQDEVVKETGKRRTHY